MQDFNQIIEDYNNFSPFLIKIKDNINNFKNIYHSFIFSYLLGYFSKYNISNNDFEKILNNYNNDNFNIGNFFLDFKKIAFIFCDYFEKNKKISKSNNNLFNENILFNNNNIFENQNFNFSNNNNINQSNHFNFSNNNIINQSNHFNFVNNNHINQNKNENENFNFINNNNINQNKNINENSNYINQNDNFNIFNINSNNDINNIDDYQLAQQLAEEEKIMFQKQQEEDSLKQVKKCEICLEDFSLLDCTNYFLNCNCILHNKCFDDMVKAAVENNTLPIKCPNCKVQIHPNFIEDSIRNANPQLLPKYDKFSMNNFLQNNSDEYSSCPTPGCEYMFFFNPGDFNYVCPMCTKHYCLNCKDEWHVGMTCQEYKDSRDVNKLDDQFFKFVKGAKFKMCPKCKYWVEKNQGCNHMKCRCGADFCYLCGQLMDMSKSHRCR